VESNHHPYKDARAKHAFESFLGRVARIAAVSNMWCLLVPAPQHLGAAGWQTCSGTAIRTLFANRVQRSVNR
jgi:hypothetical protein